MSDGIDWHPGRVNPDGVSSQSLQTLDRVGKEGTGARALAWTAIQALVALVLGASRLAAQTRHPSPPVVLATAGRALLILLLSFLALYSADRAGRLLGGAAGCCRPPSSPYKAGNE
jgi:hypothetical protein